MKGNSAKLRVQFGCGLSAPEAWLNFDCSPTIRFEKLPIIGRLYTKNEERFPSNVEYGDIVRGLPLPSGSCTAVYASHVLEHLSLREFRMALRNTHQLLEPGGRFRLVLPDLEILARRYLDSKDATAALEFMRETSLGIETRSRTLLGFLRSWLGNSSHLWMWDFKSLAHELSAAGFANIEKRSFGDEPLFADVEDATRFVNTVAVGCAKR
ncbi:MAG: hypothetical protein AUJ04_06485 [Acidobacteria bacterium 13_1_40CM_3_55_6]|nr:MAG: hypothetical protein AUJ04_06485 [Acidobacteria bacterium 13_1_40CM_3_55_6]